MKSTMTLLVALAITAVLLAPAAASAQGFYRYHNGHGGRGGEVYGGWIKDVRPAWDLLVLTVGRGKEARDLGLDMGEARIVGPSGSEWKGQDLRLGDRVHVVMTPDGRLVQQINVLPDTK
jgi:hypothetical protein